MYAFVFRYNEDEEFNFFCGQIDALAFLPINEVSEGFEHLRRIAPDGCDDLLEYFDTYYVNGTLRQRNIGNGNLRINIRRFVDFLLLLRFLNFLPQDST